MAGFCLNFQHEAVRTTFSRSRFQTDSSKFATLRPYYLCSLGFETCRILRKDAWSPKRRTFVATINCSAHVYVMSLNLTLDDVHRETHERGCQKQIISEVQRVDTLWLYRKGQWRDFGTRLPITTNTVKIRRRGLGVQTIRYLTNGNVSLA